MSSRKAIRAVGAIVVVACTPALLGGCASPRVAAPAAEAAGSWLPKHPRSNVARVGFLTDYARLRPCQAGGGMLCWRSPDVNWKRYDKVMFERIQVYIAPGSQKPVDPTDLKMLIDYFHGVLVKAMQGRGSGRERCRARRASRAHRTHEPRANQYGRESRGHGGRPMASSQRSVPAPRPAGRRARRPTSGRPGMEVQFRDGATGNVVAECADTEIGRKYAADLKAGARRRGRSLGQRLSRFVHAMELREGRVRQMGGGVRAAIRGAAGRLDVHGPDDGRSQDAFE